MYPHLVVAVFGEHLLHESFRQVYNGVRGADFDGADGCNKKYLAKTGKVFQTSTLPKLALYQDSGGEYTIIFKTLSSHKENDSEAGWSIFQYFRYAY